jgi:hypothetical protein
LVDRKQEILHVAGNLTGNWVQMLKYHERIDNWIQILSEMNAEQARKVSVPEKGLELIDITFTNWVYPFVIFQLALYRGRLTIHSFVFAPELTVGTL